MRTATIRRHLTNIRRREKHLAGRPEGIALAEAVARLACFERALEVLDRIATQSDIDQAIGDARACVEAWKDDTDTNRKDNRP